MKIISTHHPAVYVIACYESMYNIKIILCKHLWLRQSSFNTLIKNYFDRSTGTLISRHYISLRKKILGYPPRGSSYSCTLELIFLKFTLDFIILF